MSIEILTDGSGQHYVNVGNVRLTVVEGERWAGPEVRHYLRLQAYKGEPEASGLNQGAELPIRDLRSVLELLAGISFCWPKNYDDTAPSASEVRAGKKSAGWTPRERVAFLPMAR